MSIRTHIIELEKKHEALDVELHLELARPFKDDLKVASLKRKKLRLKDEIARESMRMAS